MKVIKPLDLSLFYKSFDWEGTSQLAVSIFLAFPLEGADAKEAMLEQDMWTFLAEALGKDAILDIGMPKPNGEALVHGTYFAPGGRPVTADSVEIKVGSLHKSLAVIGNRYWRTLLGPTDPEPIKELPLTYAHAFGGKDHKPNPTGIGIDKIDVFGEMRLPLPNIEDPEQLITSTGNRPVPAGFGPLDVTWEQRMSKMGTYDDKWLREQAPGYAEDLDWNHFNAAAPDQWLNGFFQGDESYELYNMHPNKPIVQGALPSYRTRCFVNQKSEDVERFKEVAMKAETVFFFPDAEIGILLYRGTINTAEDDASDILNMIVGYEHLHESPRSADHYEQAMHNRLDPDNDFKYLMNTVDLIPTGVRCGFARMLEAVDEPLGAMGQNIENKAESLKNEAMAKLEEQKARLTEQLTAAGIDPAPYLEKMKIDSSTPIGDHHTAELMKIADQIAPGMSDDPKNIDLQKLDLSKMDDLGKKMEEIAEIKKQEAKEKLQNMLKDLPAKPEADATREKIEAAIANMDKPPALPRPSGDKSMEQWRAQVAQSQTQIQQLRAQGVAEEKLPKIDFDLEEVEQKMREGFAQLKDTYRMGAHMMEPGSSPHDQPLDIILYRFNKALDKGEKLAGGDFACIDLSGRDLTGINLSEAYLEQVDFSGATLKGANLQGAIIAHANLAGADLSGANLNNANIGGACLINADLTDADLSDAKLGKADLNGARLIRCKMEGVELLETRLAGVDMSEATLKDAIFLELDITAARFIKTQMPGSNFVKCTLSGADFSEAYLDESNWVECTLDNTIFNNAGMTNTRFPGACSLKNADFSGASLDRSNFRDADLEGANFSHASLNMADFGDARLKKADFNHSIAKRAQFIKANLEQANMSSMNLMEATLMKARLTNTDISYSNCYAVEFMNATVGSTDFTGTNFDRSKLENWQPSK
jgi:uncharacterized protein YjbI with pentapeptide repeats